MTNTQRIAMQQALDALEPLSAYGRVGSRDVEQAAAQVAIATLRKTLAEPQPAQDATIIALHEALAEPVVEPVMWKDVGDYEGLYEVSSDGDIRNKTTGKLISKSLMGAGYVKASLFKHGKRWQTSAHRIVAAAFVDNPNGHREVNHINGVKTDNRASNLEWVSRSENMVHSDYELGNRVRPAVATNLQTGEETHYPSVNAAERDGFRADRLIHAANGKRSQHRGHKFSYASPPPPADVPLLTDEDIGMQMSIAWGHTSIAPRQAPTFARAIEQAVRQKAGIK